jgi:hypothetical protein
MQCRTIKVRSGQTYFSITLYADDARLLDVHEEG